MRDLNIERSDKDLKCQENPTSTCPPVSCCAFADHPPPTRESGQQNETYGQVTWGLGTEERGEREGNINNENKKGEEKTTIKVLEMNRTTFFENSQVTTSNNPIHDFGDFRLLKVKEVATILGCSVKEVYTFSYECGLPTRKLRGRVRVLGSDLKKWLEDLPTKRRSAA